MVRKRAFSGIQPTGNLHIGNYLGAIRQWVERQAEFDNIFCVVDLHAITVPQDPAELHEATRQVAALYVACGIDPRQSVVCVQSHISAHAELAWILNCVAPMGWLGRMTQFKEKSAKQRETVSAGLFVYPALMAADILLYHTDVVPVGEDQRQHVELTRDLAIRFNQLFGEVFTVPEALIRETGARIMSLAEPTKKMSKSEPAGSIALLDPPDTIRRKIARAKTDPLTTIEFDESRPGIYNLLTIYELLSGQDRPTIEARFQGKGYAEFKRELADLVVEALRPMQERYAEIRRDPASIEAVLRDSADRIRPTAERTLSEVKVRMGLG
ncbi:MAG: tryptophan--tRNA ligase [Chloroflexi bacterium]|nr:tryptophan--tRNA ligase [Chloroflexota bacterium]